jgi:hypothetical protein
MGYNGGYKFLENKEKKYKDLEKFNEKISKK